MFIFKIHDKKTFHYLFFSYDITKGGIMNNFKIANDFNVYVLNDHAQSYVDSEGRVAVTNNATYINYGIGSHLTPSTTRADLIVGGAMNIIGGTNSNGNSVISDLNNVILYTMTNANGVLPQPIQDSPINFAEQNAYLNCASTNWALITPNGTAKVEFGGLTLTGTSNTLNVFNINGNNIAGSGLGLANLNKIDIVSPVGSTNLINVSGTILGFGSFGMFRNGVTATGADGQYILWNLYEATLLNAATTSVKGSLLAPLATYNSGFTNIEGTIMVYNLFGNIEAHLYPFLGSLPDVCSTTTTTTTTSSTTTSSTSTDSTTSTSTSTTFSSSSSTSTMSTTTTNPCAYELAVSNMINSVSNEEEALAKLIEAESKKILIAIENCLDCKDLLCINNSVESMMDTITKLEIVLGSKIKISKNLCNKSCE